MNFPTIFQYVIAEENKYQTDKVRIGSNWEWSMKDHVQLIFHLKNGQFYTGQNDFLRAFKNIMEPMLNLAYWTEDLEVKDVTFFIESRNGRVLSFLTKKYHDEVLVRKYNLDTLFDEITESDLDYGGVLVQKTNVPKPEIIELNAIDFCDQTDILGSPLGFQLYFSPDKLRKMSAIGWGNPDNGATITLKELCVLAKAEKEPASMPNSGTNAVPGKQIKVVIVRGSLPNDYLYDDGDFEYHSDQLQIIAFYQDKEGKKQGVTLYRKEESEASLMFHTSKKVFGRALGRGVGEALIPDQIWTNFLEIHKMNMLEAGSKIPLYTDDPSYVTRNKIQDMENLEITTVADGKRIFQVPTAAPMNIQLFENSINTWFEHAQLTGSAFDPILGKEQASGTTFRGQERTVAQGRGIHDRRRGQRAKFIEEVYRMWILPYIKREVTKGKEFLATLSSEDMMWVSQALADNYASRQQVENTLNGKPAGDKEVFKQRFLDDFSKRGNKHLIKILKDEFKDVELKMGINIAGKQKDLVNLTDKVLSIFQFVFANPAGFQQAMQIPALSRAFQDILEFSGMNTADFSSLMTGITAQQPVPGQTPPAPQNMNLNRQPVETA